MIDEVWRTAVEKRSRLARGQFVPATQAERHNFRQQSDIMGKVAQGSGAILGLSLSQYWAPPARRLLLDRAPPEEKSSYGKASRTRKWERDVSSSAVAPPFLNHGEEDQKPIRVEGEAFGCLCQCRIRQPNRQGRCGRMQTKAVLVCALFDHHAAFGSDQALTVPGAASILHRAAPKM